MATIESVFSKNLYSTPYDYNKVVVGVDASHPRTYLGTVIVPAGLTQKNSNTFPIIHAKDVQIGQEASERLTEKLNAYDIILREIYGRAPAVLEALVDGRSTEALAALTESDGAAGAAGIDSISRIADILNNRTETIDDRLVDLRIFKTITVAQSSAVTTITTNTDSVIADNNNDTVTFTAGNKWILLAANANTDTITIAHSISALSQGTHASNWQTNYLTTQEVNGESTQVPTEQQPNFGDTVSFVVPAISFDTDEAGHVTAFAQSYIQPRIKIPKGSIGDTDKGTKNVMTGLALTDTSMTFSREWSYLADLLLTNYTYDNSFAIRPQGKTATYTIAASDALKVALAKLQAYAISNHNAIDQEASDRDTAITNLIDSAGSDYNTLGKIETAITNHLDDKNNPHEVTAAQLSLDNLTNDKQIKAIQSSTDSRIALWDGATGDLLKVSDFTIGCSVPADAVFTDTTYTQATDEDLGLVKLYNTTGDNDDGTMTQAAIIDAVNAAIGNALSSFTGLTLKLPASVVWSVDEVTDELFAAPTQYLDECEITIEKLESGDWIPVTEFTRVAGDEFRAIITRTLEIGNATYENSGVVGPNYIEPTPPEPEPEPESEPEEP